MALRAVSHANARSPVNAIFGSVNPPTMTRSRGAVAFDARTFSVRRCTAWGP